VLPPGLSVFKAAARAISRLATAEAASRLLPNKYKPKFNDKDFLKGVHNLEKDIAKNFHKTLLNNFRKNTYGYSLPEKTIATKTGRYKNVPLVRTAEYITKGIVVDGKSVRVKEGKHKSGIEYEELASIHEFGRRDKSIPARPVWRKTFTAYKPTAKSMVEKFLYPKGRRR
jgi:hypothetical protein